MPQKFYRLKKTLKLPENMRGEYVERVGSWTAGGMLDTAMLRFRNGAPSINGGAMVRVLEVLESEIDLYAAPVSEAEYNAPIGIAKRAQHSGEAHHLNQLARGHSDAAIAMPHHEWALHAMTAPAVAEQRIRDEDALTMAAAGRNVRLPRMPLARKSAQFHRDRAEASQDA